jgi:threonine synthase
MAPMFPDIHLHIFCGESFVQRLNFSDSPNVTVYKVEGSFVAAGKAARQFASRQGFTPEAGFFNPARREGLKLAYLEAFDEMPLQPSVVIQAVSSGMGLYGAQKGIDEYLALGRLTVAPRIVCAQQQTCSPMYNGWRDGVTQLGDEYVIPNPEGLAEAILRGDARDTYPYMRRIVESSGGCFEIANEAEILRARKMAFELEDLDICNASSVALAVAFRLARRGWIDKEEAVLVNLTGADRASNLVPTVIDYG